MDEAQLSVGGQGQSLQVCQLGEGLGCNLHQVGTARDVELTESLEVEEGSLVNGGELVLANVESLELVKAGKGVTGHLVQLIVTEVELGQGLELGEGLLVHPLQLVAAHVQGGELEQPGEGGVRQHPDVVLGEVELGQAGQGGQSLAWHGLQQVVAEVEDGEVGEAGEGCPGDLPDPVLAQPQLPQLLERPEDPGGAELVQQVVPQPQHLQPPQPGEGAGAQARDLVVLQPQLHQPPLRAEAPVRDGDQLVGREVHQLQLRVELEAGVHRVEVVVLQDQLEEARV